MEWVWEQEGAEESIGCKYWVKHTQSSRGGLKSGQEKCRYVGSAQLQTSEIQRHRKDDGDDGKARQQQYGMS